MSEKMAREDVQIYGDPESVFKRRLAAVRTQAYAEGREVGIREGIALCVQLLLDFPTGTRLGIIDAMRALAEPPAAPVECKHPPHACVAIGKINFIPGQSLRCEDCGEEWHPGDPPWPKLTAPAAPKEEG